MVTEKRKLYSKEYRLKNREKALKVAKEYYKNNKERSRIRSILTKTSHPAQTVVVSSRKGAKRRGLEHTITVEDINIPEKCPYLGIPLTWIQGEGLIDSNISIDRIDSSKGYIKGNVQVISYLANKMKQNANEETLISFAEGVLKLHGRVIHN